MRAIATYVMKGRMQAIMVIAVLGQLSLIVPPLFYLSGGAVALVALRLGPMAALQTVAGAALAVFLLSWLTLQNATVGFVFPVLFWLPIALLGQLLRHSMDLAGTIAKGSLFAVILVLLFYLQLDDPAQWWDELLGQVLAPHIAGIEGAEGQIKAIAGMMTGVVAAGYLFVLLGCLLLGRWWQSLLFNPGGFSQEYHNLGMGRALSMVTIALLLGSQVSEGAGIAMVGDLAVVAASLFLMQGMAVAHAVVKLRNTGVVWLVVLYFALILPLTAGISTMLVVLVGLLDNWFDIRAWSGGKVQE